MYDMKTVNPFSGEHFHVVHDMYRSIHVMYDMKMFTRKRIDSFHVVHDMYRSIHAYPS